jgi:hypothetical protein
LPCSLVDGTSVLEIDTHGDISKLLCSFLVIVICIKILNISANEIPAVIITGLNARLRNVFMLSQDFSSPFEILSIPFTFSLPTVFKQKSSSKIGERMINARR